MGIWQFSALNDSICCEIPSLLNPSEFSDLHRTYIGQPSPVQGCGLAPASQTEREGEASVPTEHLVYARHVKWLTEITLIHLLTLQGGLLIPILQIRIVKLRESSPHRC